ncbi:MAG TPA: RluA family pseudouridine synthase [Tepidisphaeraceae bacterium]|nr:RluA family pseudouridine synthase [Tepidisphaeraceae bacterium]
MASSPKTVLDWLVARYPTAKKQTLKRMIESRRVRVNGMPARALKQTLNDIDIVELTGRRADFNAPVPAPFPIIYEDSDVLVIDKPPGLLTSTVPREPRPTAWAMAREYIRTKEPRARIGLIHRLDRDASGLLVFSKNDPAYRSLKTQFFKHSVLRVYSAIVKGVPSPRKDRIESWLVELPDGKMKSTKRPGAGERAVSEYETLETAGKISLVRVTLETGKKHQIRVHLGERGAPILNDPLYNDDAPCGRMMLTATQLDFGHPRTGKRMRFELSLPKEADDLLRVHRK